MNRIFTVIIATLAVSACGPSERVTFAPSEVTRATPTQLELSIGLLEDEWGRFTLAQLAQIKGLQDADDMIESEAETQIAFIKKYALLNNPN